MTFHIHKCKVTQPTTFDTDIKNVLRKEKNTLEKWF